MHTLKSSLQSVSAAASARLAETDVQTLDPQFTPGFLP